MPTPRASERRSSAFDDPDDDNALVESLVTGDEVRSTPPRARPRPDHWSREWHLLILSLLRRTRTDPARL